MPTCFGEQELPERPSVNHFGGQQVVWLKRHTAVIRRGQRPALQIVLRDANGDPLDLSDCADNGESSSVSGDSPVIVGRICEATTSGTSIYSVDGEIVDAATGLVSVTPPVEVSELPGIYIAEVAALLDGNTEQIVTSQQLCLWVEPGLFGNASNISQGPPLWNDLRIALRDFTEENELLDSVDFDASEITYALIQPIRDWNEALPPIRRKYTTQTFPSRSNWMAAATGYLFRTAAEHYRRNQLPYNAGGTSIDDKNKARDYDQRGDGLLAQWNSFVKSRKMSDNISRGYGTLGSAYGGRW